MVDTPTLSHYINGSTVAGASTRTSPVYNPATGAVAKNVRLASTTDIGTAVAAALSAFPGGVTPRRPSARPSCSGFVNCSMSGAMTWPTS